MKKEKLITVIEAKKYWTVVFAIGFFPIVVAYIFFYPINNGFTTFYWFNFAHIFIFFFVVYFITFWKWYPFVQRKNKAFKNGRVINAKIIRVNRLDIQ